MKNRFTNKLNPQITIGLAVLLVAIIIHSCKRDNASANQQHDVLNTSMVNMAKQWYTTTYPTTKNTAKLATESLGGGSNAWNQTFIPYWSKANTYTIDSLQYIELPSLKHGDMAMSDQNVSPGSFNFTKSQSLTSLIIVNNGGNFYMYAMTILADSSYLNGDYTKLAKNTYRYKDNNFSGRVFYHRMDGSFVNGWRFQNGVVTGVITLAVPGTPTGPTTQNRREPVRVAEEVDCQTTITTTYWEQCSYYVDDVNDENPFDCFDYTTQSSFTVCAAANSPGGGSSNPNPCTPASGGSGGSSSPPPVEAARHTVRVADPNPPNGGTNPAGGIVDQQNQIGTTQCTPAAPPADTTKDPCSQIKHADSLAQNAGKSNIYSQLIKDTYTGHEYGDEQNMNTWPPNGAYTFTPLRTDMNDTKFTPNFTWVPGAYTININHEHPQGDAPSPADVFALYTNYFNKNLQTAGTAALNYYQNNMSLTTVTTNGTYIITISSFSALANLYNQQSVDSWNTDYENEADANGFSTEYALLKLFGGAINVFKANANSTTFSVLTFDKNGNVTIITCPN